MSKKKNSGLGTAKYFGLGRVLSIVCAIFPITAWIFGLVITAKRRHWLLFVLRIFLGFNILWIVDLITMIASRKIYLV